MAGLLSKPTPTQQQGRHDFLETPKNTIMEAPEKAKEVSSSDGDNRRKRRKLTPKGSSLTLLGDE